MDHFNVDSPHDSSYASATDNTDMPPIQHTADQTPQLRSSNSPQLGSSNFPLPIRSSSPFTTANEGDSLSFIISTPDQGMDFPSPSFPASSIPRKRGRETVPSFSAESIAKSRKTTPSPALTGDTTPASFGSFDFLQDPHFVRMLGGDPRDHMAEMLEEQRAQQQELERKQRQEREDAEFARQLAVTFQCDEPVQPSGPNQSNSQSFLDYNGNIQRSDSMPLLEFGTDPAPQPNFAFNPNPTGTFKGISPPPKIASGNFGNFIDLSHDDEAEIPQQPAVPKVNGRNDQPAISNFSWKDFPADGVTSTSPDMANTGSSFGSMANTDGVSFEGLGGSGVYSQSWNGNLRPERSTNWADRMAAVGHNATNVMRGAWTSAYNLLDQQIASYPTNSYGYGQPYTGHGQVLSSGPTVIDLDSYDESRSAITSYPYQNPVTRSFPRDDDIHDRYMERVNYLANDPTKTTAEIKDLLENIRPDEELPIENREGTPDAMVYPLMEHQKLGLAWMKSMEEGSNKGGILADDMGLGKTIQALALMVARRSQDPNRKTTLIVAPLALMKQWEREIQMKLKGAREHKLTTYILHGQGRGASWNELKLYDVVLTTFGTLATEIKRKEIIEKAKRENPNWQPLNNKDRLPLLGDESKWYRVILDEAQCIKNKATKAAQGAHALQSLTRFCMSGTPMQNSVSELYSLIHFLHIRPYNDHFKFSMDFIRPLKSTIEPEKARAMQKLQALLKAILLRRNKKSTIDGKPILTLPERTTESRHADFSEDEQAFYSALESRTQLQFNKYLNAGTVGRNYSNVLVLLLRLRQACCHPHLIKDFATALGATGLPTEDLVKMAKELAPDVVARIIEQGDINDQSGLECPVCMDATENATIFIPCGHNTCSECFARISHPSQAIANGDDGGTNLKCPQCRGKISASRVTDHSTFKQVHIGLKLAAEELAEELQGPSDSESDTDDDLADDEGSDLAGFIVSDDEIDDEGYRKGNTPFERCFKAPTKKKHRKSKGKAKAEDKPPRKSLAQLKKESLRNVKAHKRYMARIRKTWVSSAKIDKTVEILQGIYDAKEGEKTIIFSQFTSLLDLLEIPIYDRGWKYKRYDGSMSATARNDAVLEFQDKPDCKIMLVSLRAGNSGLNLVAASQVIMLDPFWNPYVEEQAIDRAHRIGQQRPVQVHRILIPGTVEDRILNLQEKKRAMIESALDESASKEVGRLGVRELGYLFGVHT